MFSSIVLQPKMFELPNLMFAYYIHIYVCIYAHTLTHIPNFNFHLQFLGLFLGYLFQECW